jgi:hypothetical protein
VIGLTMRFTEHLYAESKRQLPNGFTLRGVYSSPHNENEISMEQEPL